MDNEERQRRLNYQPEKEHCMRYDGIEDMWGQPVVTDEWYVQVWLAGGDVVPLLIGEVQGAGEVVEPALIEEGQGAGGDGAPPLLGEEQGVNGGENQVGEEGDEMVEVVVEGNGVVNEEVVVDQVEETGREEF